MTQRKSSEIVDQTPTAPSIPIYYEDDYLIVISKPAGILSQADSSGDPPITELVEKHLRQSSNTGSKVYLIHRLDRPVSGLMVLAKRKDAAQHLTKQFREHRVRKSYWLVCVGEVSRTGVLQHWIQKVENPVRALVFDDEKSSAKKAVLSYRKLASTTLSTDTFSLVEVHLQTGRPHQIRAQFSHIGHPIVGDAKYGSTFKSVDIHLRSVMLEFTHPNTQTIQLFNSFPASKSYWKHFSKQISQE